MKFRPRKQQLTPVDALVHALRKRHRYLNEADAQVMASVLLREVAIAIREGHQVTLVPDRFMQEVEKSAGTQIADAATVQKILGTDLIAEAARLIRSRRRKKD